MDTECEDKHSWDFQLEGTWLLPSVGHRICVLSNNLGARLEFGLGALWRLPLIVRGTALYCTTLYYTVLYLCACGPTPQPIRPHLRLLLEEIDGALQAGRGHQRDRHVVVHLAQRRLEGGQRRVSLPHRTDVKTSNRLDLSNELPHRKR